MITCSRPALAAKFEKLTFTEYRVLCARLEAVTSQVVRVGNKNMDLSSSLEATKVSLKLADAVCESIWVYMQNGEFFDPVTSKAVYIWAEDRGLISRGKEINE